MLCAGPGIPSMAALSPCAQQYSSPQLSLFISGQIRHTNTRRAAKVLIHFCTKLLHKIASQNCSKLAAPRRRISHTSRPLGWCATLRPVVGHAARQPVSRPLSLRRCSAQGAGGAPSRERWPRRPWFWWREVRAHSRIQIAKTQTQNEN